MTSRIVLSFANYDGGTIFIHTFRNKLMKRLNWYGDNTVYLDNVACRSVAGSTYHGPDKRIIDGKAVGSQGGNSYCIGVSNPLWKQMWDQAVTSAKAIVMIVNPAYMDSPNCGMEAQTIATLINSRSDLHLIVVDVGPGDNASKLPDNLKSGGNRITVLNFDKVEHSMKNIFPAAFDLTDQAYELIVDALNLTGATAPGPGL